MADNGDSRSSARRGLFQRSSVQLALIGDRSYAALVAVLREDAKYRDFAFHEALEDFIRANSTIETKLVFPRKLPDNIVAVHNAEVQGIFDKTRTLKDAGDAIRERFGGIDGIYEVSRPGVDAHQRVALICLSYSSQPGTVTGRFYILTFDGVRWVVQKDDFFGTSWMS